MPSKQALGLYRILGSLRTHLAIMFALLYLFDKSLLLYILRTVCIKLAEVLASWALLKRACLLVLAASAASFLRHITLQPSHSLVIDFVGQSWTNKATVLTIVDAASVAVQLCLVILAFKKSHAIAMATPDTATSPSSARSDGEVDHALIAQVLEQVRNHVNQQTGHDQRSALPTPELSAVTTSVAASQEPTIPQQPVGTHGTARLPTPPSASHERSLLLTESALTVQPDDTSREDDLMDEWVVDLSWATVCDLFHQARAMRATLVRPAASSAPQLPS
ncbi:hypothetical protein H4R35_006159 [Dimargaris xerosporica]|nr:hypothetical protein H4R35_006159 [Dimargaris xerosporica]